MSCLLYTSERARELISEENRRMTLVRTNTLAERIKLNGDVEPAAPVSYTHLDVYKRQISLCGRI